MKFTSDWFTIHIPVWEEFLQKSNSKINILEIGSYEGRSTIWLLNRFPNSLITCIDVFQQEKTFDENTKEAKVYGRITKLKGASGEQLKKVNGKFDIVYIDGGHTFQEAMTDLVLSWPLLNINGLLIFDDYSHSRYKCGAAMDVFTSHWDGISILHKDRQVIVRKSKEPLTSVSFLNK